MTIVDTAMARDHYNSGTQSDRAPTLLRRHRGKLALSVVLLSALGGGGLFLLKSAPAAAKKDTAPVAALTVTVTKVEAGKLPRSLMVTGSLAARDELPVGTETTGLALVEVLVDVGDHVRQGQLLARFNDSVLRAQVQQAEAALHEAEANAEEANANARRADELVRSGWISGKDYDNRRATAQTMAARVGVAKANLALAAAKLKQAELRAPSDGTITARTAHLGAVVAGGEMFRMIRDDRVELVAELPEQELAAVKPGQPMTMALEGSGDVIAGTVRLVEPTVDVKTRIGRVRIDIDSKAGLLPGMFVNGHLLLGQTEGLITEEKAVVYLDGKPNVFLLDDSGKVQSHLVELGPRDHGRIALLSGVKEGDRLALRGAAYLKDGNQVTVVDAPAAPGGAPHSL